MPDDVEDLLRRLAPQVLGAVVRRYGQFDLAEDAVQEALVAAAQQWPADGVPDSPKGWLITVASRRLTDLLRAESARRRREDTVARWTLTGDSLAPAADRPAAGSDDTLILLFLCCHPSLSTASQIALTLRAVGGLSTAEIARAFLVPEATMTRRITRAKQRIKDSGLPFGMPAPADRGARLGAVLHVLYLIFNEGYASTAGPALHRSELSAEAIRLTRMVRRLLPDDGEVAGLLALMLLTDARRPARTGPDGALIPMAEQDRSRWNAAYVAEGVALLTEALPRGATGPYQLQAAIAAIHDEAPSADETDWPQILSWYDDLVALTADPVRQDPAAVLARAVAVGHVLGPAAGLRETERLRDVIGDRHRWHAVRGYLHERDGDMPAAATAYAEASRLATTVAERDHLVRQAAQAFARETGVDRRDGR